MKLGVQNGNSPLGLEERELGERVRVIVRVFHHLRHCDESLTSRESSGQPEQALPTKSVGMYFEAATTKGNLTLFLALISVPEMSKIR